FIAASAVSLQAGAIRALRAAGYEGALYGMTNAATRDLLDAAGPEAEGLKAPAILNPDDLQTTHPRLAEIVAPIGGLKNFGSFMGAQAMAILFDGLKSNPANGIELAQAIENAGPIVGYAAAPV